jgi:hypothetical protein
MSSSSDAPVKRASQPPLEHLQGIVERVTYHAEDSGYTIARLKVSGMRDLITIVGRFPDIHAGQTLSLAGSPGASIRSTASNSRWSMHKKRSLRP